MTSKSGGEGTKAAIRSVIFRSGLASVIATTLVFLAVLGIAALLALFLNWDEPIYFIAVRQTCVFTMVDALRDFIPWRSDRSFKSDHYQAVGGSFLMLLVTLLIGSRNLLLSSALPALFVAIVGQIVVRIRQAKKLRSSTATP